MRLAIGKDFKHIAQPMTHASSNTVRFRDLARGVLRGLPDTFKLTKGAIHLGLLSLSADKPGSLGLLLEKQAAQHGDDTALLFEDQRWNYREFNAWANRHAHALKKRGVKSGDAVAILMENRPEVLAAVAGTVKLGGIAGMLNHNQRGDVLAHSLALTKANVLIVGEECRDAFASLKLDPSVTVVWDSDSGLRAELAAASSANPAETQAVILRQPCFYIFTSGTTGLPKASVMTHYRWLRGGVGLGELTLRLSRDDIFYCALPLYHNNALTVSWGSVLGTGAALALGRKFSATKFWDECRRTNATAFCYIGEICRYLLNRPASPDDRRHRVRLIVGNGLRTEIWDDFVARFGIERVFEFYGASECNVAFVNGFGLSKTAGYCPMSFAVAEFDAETETPKRDATGFMKKVATGAVGLLITEINERNPFDGYTDKKASDAKLLKDVFTKGDCWFNTGDLVRNQGYKHIQFIDRVGDTFRWKGENVATTEIEAALNKFAGVEQACVYGVEVPGADGRAGMAALTIAGAFDGAALSAHLQNELPAYAVPVFIRLRAEQEMTGTFKFRKVELKKEGFDPSKISDGALYALLDRERGYEPVTAEVFNRIRSGTVRL